MLFTLNRVIQIHAGVFLMIRSLKILLIRIIFIIVFDLGISSASGHITSTAFRTDSGMNGHGGRYYLAVIGCSLGVSIADMLLLVRADGGSSASISKDF